MLGVTWALLQFVKVQISNACNSRNIAIRENGRLYLQYVFKKSLLHKIVVLFCLLQTIITTYKLLIPCAL